jgi:predicted RecB family endonuclease
MDSSINCIVSLNDGLSFAVALQSGCVTPNCVCAASHVMSQRPGCLARAAAPAHQVLSHSWGGAGQLSC